VGGVGAERRSLPATAMCGALERVGGDWARRIIGRAVGGDRGVWCHRESSMAKAYATEAAVKVTNFAIQLHGSYGLAKEAPLEGWARDARMLTLPDGTTQIHQLIIGRELVGLRAFA